MALPGARITVSVEPPTAFIRVAGRAAVERARDFKGLVQRLQGEGIHEFVLDLSECVLMDSTFSGVLAGLASAATPPANPAIRGPATTGVRFTLVDANDRVTDLLDNLGVLELVRRVSGGRFLSRAAGVELTADLHSKTETTICCLEAHQLLMGLKADNVAKFQTLEQFLTAELRKGAVAAAPTAVPGPVSAPVAG